MEFCRQSPVFPFKFACELLLRSHQNGRHESHCQTFTTPKNLFRRDADVLFFKLHRKRHLLHNVANVSTLRSD